MINNQISLSKYRVHFVIKYKFYLLSLVIIAISAGIFQISVDYKIKEIIDTITSDQNTEIFHLLILFAFYKLMHHGVYFLRRLLDIRYKPAIVAQTITDIYQSTVRHSLHWFDSHLSGEITNKISDFQDGITKLITHLFSALNTVVTIIITFIFLININLFSSLVLLIFILTYSPIIYWLLQRQMNLQSSYIKTRQEVVGIINDSISNIFAIKAIGDLAAEFKLKIKPSLTKWQFWEKKTRKFDAYYVDNADTIMITIMTAGQMYLLAYLYKNGQITAGSFAFIAMITLKLHGQLDTLLDNLLFNINPGIAQIKSSYSFINTKLNIEDKLNAKILTKVRGKIEYKNVDFSYDENSSLILHDFNLEIKPGEQVGIVGASGAGKTTMMKCLLRYFDILKGAILIDDVDIRDVSQESLRKSISVIPQDVTMFHRTIKENLKLANYNATDDEIISACQKARIHEDIMAMVNQYDTIVGERGVKLSGGQRQRIAIARAILKNTPILILDEATSSLDTATEKLVQQSIHDLLKGSKATVIAIAHRLSTLRHMDKIIVLHKGAIAETGNHEDLMKKQNGLYKKLWSMQVI